MEVRAAERARVRIADHVPTGEELAGLIRLALPVAGVQVGLMAMGVVDTVMVGRVSATDLAAVAIGHLYFYGVTVFGMGILYALDPVVSQAVGASDSIGVARGVQRGGVLAAALSVLAMLLLVPAGTVLGALGHRRRWSRWPGRTSVA